MAQATNTTTAPIVAKPWAGAMVYLSEVQDKGAIDAASYLVTDISDKAFKVDGHPHWLPLHRAEYILPDFTMGSGSPDDRKILSLFARRSGYRSVAAVIEPEVVARREDWKAASVKAGVWAEQGSQSVEAEQLAEHTDYSKVRDAWQHELMMAHLCEDAILLMTANTIEGLAAQAEVVVRTRFDLADEDFSEITFDKVEAKFSVDYSDRNLFKLAKTACAMAANKQQERVGLRDLDITDLSLGTMSGLALELKKFSEMVYEFSDHPQFTFTYETGPYAGAKDLNANGKIVEKIVDWADTQHNRVMDAIEQFVPQTSDEAYERTLSRVEWAWRCGEGLTEIAAMVAEGQQQQAAFAEQAKGAESADTVLAEFAKLDASGKAAVLRAARQMQVA